MPCSDVRPGDREFERQLHLFWQAVGEDYCTYCTAMEQAGKPIPERLKRWWKAHKEYDEARWDKENTDD